jgi:SPP1 gp7 family putative phage head morphogenesis protein
MEVMNSVTSIGDNTIQRNALTRLYSERLNGKVAVMINEHQEGLINLIKSNLSANISISDKLTNEVIDKEIQRFSNEAYRMTAGELIDFGTDTAGNTTSTLSKGFNSYFSPIPVTRTISADIVLKRSIINNTLLKDMWGNLTNAERGRIEKHIRDGLAAGMAEADITNSMSKVFNLTKSHSSALVVTATTSVYAQVDQEVYLQNKAFLLGYQYVAILDSRTTSICAHRDHQIYPVEDTSHLPPAHINCRSTTIPVPKSWDDLLKNDAVRQARMVNTAGLTSEQVLEYDKSAARWFTGTPFEKITYNDWLKRQPERVQLIHLGSFDKLRLFQSNQLTVDQFVTNKGASIGKRELRQISGEEGTLGGYNGSTEGTSAVFNDAKDRLDSLVLGFTGPDEIINDIAARNKLIEYYSLQSKELNGRLSLTNYRGILTQNKSMTKSRVLQSPPTEEQLMFNPMTKRYEDARIYQPNIAAEQRAHLLIDDSKHLTDKDKEFLHKFHEDIKLKIGMNEASVVSDNLRVVFERARKNGEIWGNFKAVLNGEMRYSVTNVSEYIETNIRNSSDFFAKLKQADYLDPVLGPVQLEKLGKNFYNNIIARNDWEIKVIPKIASEIRPFLDLNLPPKLALRLTDFQKQEFYRKFATQLAKSDAPDRDQLAISLGRDLYNVANYRGSKQEWYSVGVNLLDRVEDSGLYKLETFGVKKRRMRSKMSGQYFGQYYDTTSMNVVVTDPRILEYAKLSREVDVGFRIGVNEIFNNKLEVREGFKTFFFKQNGLYYDSQIPITSSHSFVNFPVSAVDKNLTDALNWASKSKYTIDEDFYDFTRKLLAFQDDKGKAKYYDNLNIYKDYIAARGDSYERFKAMEYYRAHKLEFSNHAFVDHRGRIYDSGLISPQSGETFRPFLNSAIAKPLGEQGYKVLLDNIGGFLGGVSDEFEGMYNGLTNKGHIQIANKWLPELIKLGNKMIRGKPQDIRDILESDIAQMVDGEELGKVMRYALELARIDAHKGPLDKYMISLALEQDASSSGAQIIALTTRNKQLAELSNVVPTNQKRRLYDVIAKATFDDPRFKRLNERLGLNEKDLRKSAKNFAMVKLYGAGERTAVLNAEKRLAKVLDMRSNMLVIKSEERDKILSEISARAARVERYDPETAAELVQLRKQVKDVLDKGLDPGDQIMDDLWFLDPKTRDVVEKLTRNYDDVVTPKDFSAIGKIMGEHMTEMTPILTDFTKFFGRLAEEFLTTAKPSEGAMDWMALLKLKAFGKYEAGYRINPWLGRVLGIDSKTPLLEQVVNKIPGFKPDSTIANILFGYRASGMNPTSISKGLKLSIGDIYKNIDLFKFGIKTDTPKIWNNVPWVNFDGVTLEQYHVQRFEERLRYQDKDGNWVTNILQVDQKTEPTWFEELINKDNTMNDIADATGARTGYAVNGNHSNDATIVKNYHLWGAKNNVMTSTIHDAFFSNVADMYASKVELRRIYAQSMEKDTIKMTLDLLLERGLPKETYNKYLNEAIDKGLIPIAGRSRVGGKLLTKGDILTQEDVLKEIREDFWNDNFGFYGIN